MKIKTNTEDMTNDIKYFLKDLARLKKMNESLYRQMCCLETTYKSLATEAMSAVKELEMIEELDEDLITSLYMQFCKDED